MRDHGIFKNQRPHEENMEFYIRAVADNRSQRAHMLPKELYTVTDPTPIYFKPGQQTSIVANFTINIFLDS